MTDRKFYERTFTITVVSEQPVESPGQLADIINEDNDERAVWCSQETRSKKLSGRQTAERLLKMGATPELFGIDKKGNDAS